MIGVFLSAELDVLKLVAKRLDENNIAYMITGSIAASYYATPRMTRDIDIVIELDSPKIDQIFQAFKNDFYIERDAVSEAVEKQKLFNIIHNEKVVKVDFIVKKQTEYRQLEFDRRRLVTVKEFAVSIVSPEDLVISKLIWAKESRSEMQFKDVQNILEDVEDIDKKYLSEWISRLDLEGIYREVKSA